MTRKNRIHVIANNQVISTHALTPRGLRAALRQRYMLEFGRRTIAHFELNGKRVEIDPVSLIILDTVAEQVL